MYALPVSFVVVAISAIPLCNIGIFHWIDHPLCGLFLLLRGKGT